MYKEKKQPDNLDLAHTFGSYGIAKLFMQVTEVPAIE